MPVVLLSPRDFVMVPLMFGMILTDSRPSESLRLLLTFDLLIQVS